MEENYIDILSNLISIADLELFFPLFIFALIKKVTVKSAKSQNNK